MRWGWLLGALAVWTGHSSPAQVPLPLTTTTGTFDESTVHLARYGDVRIERPRGEIRAVVLFLSGDGGWEPDLNDMARRLAAEGALVAGIDIRRYLSSMRHGSKESCNDLGGDLEAFSQLVQKSLRLPMYRHPLLIGYSSGAAVVYATLAAAPHGTFLGAISLGFCTDQDFGGAPICHRNEFAYARASTAKPGDLSLLLKPVAQLRDRWVVVQGGQDPICPVGPAHEFVAAAPGSKLITLPDAGHPLNPSAWWPSVRDAYRQLVSESPMPLMNEASAAAGTDLNAVPTVADLPLYATAAAGVNAAGRVAVLITGDGGWAGIDQDLSAALAARGVPVLALSSVRYFWHAHTPEETAADVGRVMRRALQQWHGQRVLLIGYSFGADILPAVINRLPDDMRQRLESLSLLGFSPNANFEISVAGWLPGRRSTGAPTAPELARIGDLPVLCVYGEGEADSPCPTLQAANVRGAEIGSGHHFSGRAVEIATAILNR
jgi:type IV secretory pathway VirJ component